MSFPTTFNNLPAGNNSLSLFDTMFSVVGSMGQIMCTAAGTNTIALTPISNMPSVVSYSNYQLFGFVAAATSSGSVTVNVSGVGAKNLYMPSGVQAGSGSLTSGSYYVIAYNSALNSAAGGFQVIGPSGSVNFITTQTFTTAGTATYTPTSGMVYCYVRGVAAGGGGGGCGASATWAVGGPGGAGSYGEAVFSSTTIGASQTVTIGSAGTAGASSGGTGGTGGNSSLGTLLTMTGGTGGTGVNANVGNGSPGAGGAAGSGGTVNVAGATSCYGFVINGTTSFSAPGANAPPFGVGGSPASGGAGTAASGKGAGGSGASAGSSGTLAGGAGGGGEVTIIEYCAQ